LSAFKDDKSKTLDVQEGKPFSLTCNPPDGYPKPQVHWIIQVSIEKESPVFKYSTWLT
jgi:hypothetical protein